MTLNDGFYDGKVVGFSMDPDNQDPDGLVLTFDVNLTYEGESRAVRCRHWTHGRNADKTKAMVTSHGFDWPGGVAMLDQMVGRDIRVQAVTYEGKQRFYVSRRGDSSRGGEAGVDEVNRRLARLKGEPEQSIF